MRLAWSEIYLGLETTWSHFVYKMIIYYRASAKGMLVLLY